MANGVIVESRIQATNIDALNRTAQAEIAVAGGGLVALTASATQGNEVWTAAAPASGTLGGLWIAYNPAEHLTVVGDKVFAGLSEDPRDYVNVANRPFDCYSAIIPPSPGPNARAAPPSVASIPAAIPFFSSGR